MVRQVIVIMGVAGVGKSTIGKKLSEKLHCKFIDADDFHPLENKQKMSNGIPLNDKDRNPWLQSIYDHILHCSDENLVVACSALKNSYRQVLSGHKCSIFSDIEKLPNHSTLFVFLQGTFELIFKRLEERSSHFMKPNMLQSQFDTLEEPKTPNALKISIEFTPKEIVSKIIKTLEI